MFTHSLAAIAIAVSTASALAPAAPPAPLNWSTDYAATGQAMTRMGFGNMAEGRTFLAFDPTGDGRAVQVIGDLDTADRIVVLIPGNDTTVANFDRGLGGVAHRAPSIQANAVHAAATANGTNVAVVAWLGYDPPEGIGLAAIRQERAADGAAELRRFVASLRSDATVVVVGHSYGSVVMALAAPELGRRVTDLVALASPGLGDLKTSARLWTATAEDDWIRHVPHISFLGFGHGADPTDPDLGARLLPTDGVRGHDRYLVPGSATLNALAEVIALEDA